MLDVWNEINSIDLTLICNKVVFSVRVWKKISFYSYETVLSYMIYIVTFGLIIFSCYFKTHQKHKNIY